MTSDAAEADWWRKVWGRRSRLLARCLQHTVAVYRFLVRLSSQPGSWAKG